MAILAGIMISIGATTYLTVGGVAGALLFAVGLMAVLQFDLKLFTGKAGLLIEKGISFLGLVKVWVGNLVGCLLTACLVSYTPAFEAI